MTTPYKLSVRIGTSEFTAEGAEETVKEQFNLFLTALKFTPPSDAKHAEPPKHENGRDSTNGDAKALAEDRATLDHVFVVDSNDLVSLRVLPKTEKAEADGLVMLLYGFHKLTEKKDVYAPTLMQAARQSGIQVSRMSRIIEANRQYINTAGVKRGMRYSLNNRGHLYAQTRIREAME